jgi:hypothetical protein
MILLANLQRSNNNLINYPIKFFNHKTLKSWNNEFEKTTLFWLEFLFYFGQILVSKQALLHSYLPFLDFVGQVMHFYNSA